MWNVIQIQHGSKELWRGHGFWLCVHSDLVFRDTCMSFCEVMHILWSWATLVWNIILNEQESTPLLLGHAFGMCVLRTWLCRHELGSRSWHILGSWTIRWTFFPNLTGGGGLKSYSQDMHEVLEIWLLVKVMTHPWIIGNNYVKSYVERFRMCALLPWFWRNGLNSRSWHILGSLTTIVWNIYQIWQGRGSVDEKLWHIQNINRQTDRQGYSYIPQVAYNASMIILVYLKCSK